MRKIIVNKIMEGLKPTIVLGSDHAGFNLKSYLKKHLTDSEKYNIIDVGTDSTTSCDFPDYAEKLCEEVLKDPENIKGVVCCGSGIGVSITCNKITGIRCGLVHDTMSARLARQHTNCNVIAMGENFIGNVLAKEIVDTYLSHELIKEEKYLRRLQKMIDIEKKY
jgi:ribose 5-phosphate isomerase B